MEKKLNTAARRSGSGATTNSGEEATSKNPDLKGKKWLNPEQTSCISRVHEKKLAELVLPEGRCPFLSIYWIGSPSKKRSSNFKKQKSKAKPALKKGY